MKFIPHLLALFLIVAVYSSCKNEGAKEADQSTVDNVVAKEELTKKEKKQINSVLTRAMSTPELKTFVSSLVTIQMVDKLSTEDGPFTILAPSNEAFANLEKGKSDHLFNIKNLDALKRLINGHIYNGELDSSEIVKKIAKGNGSFKIKTISGNSMTVFKDGSNIIFEDSEGTRAVLGKSDIKGSNGVLHVLDAVLFVAK